MVMPPRWGFDFPDFKIVKILMGNMMLLYYGQVAPLGL
jgi:hypothetical protein